MSQQQRWSMSMDGMEELDDEKDETKRKSRNLSEKKRRDQFNMLVTELGGMVSSNNRKMDKTTVLKTTIAFLKQHNQQTVRSQAEEIKDDWKPPFLSNDEFTHLMLEALDGFIIVLGTDGHILYTSESLSSLLGYLPASLHNTTLYEILGDGDKIPLYNHLNMSGTIDTSNEQQLKIQLHIRRSVTADRLEGEEVPPVLELVELSGYFRKWVNPESCQQQEANYQSDDEISVKSGFSVQNSQVPASSRYRTFHSDKTVFVATGRLVTPQLIRELPVVHQRETEFTSRHSLEWKFLFLDHRAPPIIGYLPFELLGTSGYDYYHVDDLDQVAGCHESLRQTGECTSCFYRFLTKGQQWIWLQSRYYITYHQWTSKPEFIVATHKVVNYKEVMDNANKKAGSERDSAAENKSGKTQSFRSGSPTWSSKSSLCGSTGTGFASSSRHSQDTGGNPQSSYGGYRSRQGRSAQSTNSDVIDQFQLRQDNIMMSDTMSGMDEVNSSDIAPPVESPLVLSPTQIQLQQQLRTKHAELSRRIMLQQQELARLGEQLLLTPQSLGQAAAAATANSQPYPAQQQQPHIQQQVQPPTQRQPLLPGGAGNHQDVIISDIDHHQYLQHPSNS